MQKMEKSIVFICACLTGFFSIVIGYRLFSDTFWMLIPAYLAEALMIGFAARLWPLASKYVNVIPVAIFCGGPVAVFPIIAVTYGFAIVVLVPLLAVWSAVVLLGAALGKRIQQENA